MKFLKSFVEPLFVAAVLAASPLISSNAAEARSEDGWRSLPLITNDKVSSDWMHTGFGSFAVDHGTLRTECDPRGLGLLVYKKERMGNCQIRVVFKTEKTNSNSGVYVRIDDGILKQGGSPKAAFERNAAGVPSDVSMEQVKASAEREEDAWYAVHRGYEVQIDGSGDSWHRTGAVYSLAQSSALAQKAPGEWNTMIITLDGEKILVDVNGQRVTNLDTTSSGLPPRMKWHEPKREPKRPTVGYFGLQNHDPGDVVWFKEVSVRPLSDRKK